jgi:CelD/BcsL family acetyltransferase involved in cellulose biosynthesis
MAHEGRQTVNLAPPPDGMVVELFAGEDAAWDRLVETSPNGTLMHTRRFLSYHAPDRFQDHSIVVRDGAGKLLAVMPAATVSSSEGTEWVSYPGATYGGPVFAAATPYQLYEQVLAAIVEHGRRHSFRQLRMRLAESVYWSSGHHELLNALFRLGFLLQGRELARAIPVHGPHEERHDSGFNSSSRLKLRKSQRQGVAARVTKDWPGFWSILSQTLATRHSTTPTHSLEEIRRIQELCPGRAALIGGYLGEQLVSGVFVFDMNPQVLHTMYIAMDYKHSELAPLQPTFQEVCEEARRRGRPFVNLGVSTVPGTSGYDLNFGLDEFKRRQGGRAELRETWVFDYTGEST